MRAALRERLKRWVDDRTLRVGLWLLVGGLGVVQAWRGRNYVYPDGFAYLEVAEAYLEREWATAINGYWSPLYSWILAAGKLLFDVGRPHELLLGHATLLVGFLLAMAAMEYLIRSLRFEASPAALRVFAYGLFAWASLDLIRLQYMTPDLFVLAIVLASGAVALRLAREASVLRGAALGGLLGAGYLAKAFFAPVSPFFLIPAILPHRHRPRQMMAVGGAAVLGGLIVAGPWITALSLERGRLALGDAGKLNYAWYVNGVRRHLHWQGSEDSGTPLHPTRLVLDDPEVFEFGEPFDVTYPPWYDASYWHEGLRVDVDPMQQARVLVAALAGYGQSFDWFMVFLLAIVIQAPGGLATILRRGWPLLLPGAAGLLGYGLVHVEGRLIGPWTLLLSLGLLHGVSPRRGDRSGIAGPLLVAMGVIGFLKAAEATVDVWRYSPQEPEAVILADALTTAGMEAGTPVGMIGSGFHAQWARIAELQIVAELPTQSVLAFWDMTPEKQASAMDAFRAAGAEWVIASTRPPETLRSEWEPAGDLWVRPLAHGHGS